MRERLPVSKIFIPSQSRILSLHFTFIVKKQLFGEPLTYYIKQTKRFNVWQN